MDGTPLLWKKRAGIHTIIGTKRGTKQPEYRYQPNHSQYGNQQIVYDNR
jgi:hypothetical protein